MAPLRICRDTLARDDHVLRIRSCASTRAGGNFCEKGEAVNPGDKPTERESIGLEGLDTRAEIVIDNWGIPHIRAGSLRDLFFAQGFNAARDRLWQIDLWRKRGLGPLAADFGAGYLAQDRAARLFTYRGDMDAEWAAYSPDEKDICTAFTAGINAFIALTEREPDPLPPEFIERSQPAKRKSSGKPPSRSVSGQDPTVRVTPDTVLGNIELTEGVGAGGDLSGTG